jgi:hypothetical protein
MRIVSLQTSLFPDGETVEAGIGHLEEKHEVRRIDLGNQSDQAAFDDALTAIRAADLVITV